MRIKAQSDKKNEIFLKVLPCEAQVKLSNSYVRELDNQAMLSIK